jgi:hypothetical protein
VTDLCDELSIGRSGTYSARPVPTVHRLQGVTALSMRIFTHSISPGRSRLERRRVQPPRSVRFALKSCSNSINRQGTAACCAFETWGDVSCRSLSGHCRSRRPDRKRIALRRRSRPSVRAIVETAVTDQRRNPRRRTAVNYLGMSRSGLRSTLPPDLRRETTRQSSRPARRPPTSSGGNRTGNAYQGSQ